MKAQPKISVVFVTFNRLETLRPTFESFLFHTDYPRDHLELIVADDGSRPEVQSEIRRMPFDVYVLSKRNRGIGANVNAGIAAATGEYVLQLQDDWECIGPHDYLRRAFRVLQEFEDVGCVICRPHPARSLRYQERQLGDDRVRVLPSEPSSRVKLVGQSAYTDWPHLKRRSFIAAIGPYKEHVKMWDCELDYARRVNLQTRYALADIRGLDAFRHIGADLSFNTGRLSARLLMTLGRYPVSRPIIAAARKIRRRLEDQSS